MPSTPNPPYLRRKISINSYGLYRVRDAYAFRFKNVTQFDDFIETMTRTSTDSAQATLQNMASPGYVQSFIRTEGARWFGTTNPAEITSNLQSYLYRNNLQNLTSQLSTAIQGVNVSDLDQKKVIKFTDQQMGIFSFDLASIGLIKVFEYYSPLLKRNVSSDLIVSEKATNGLMYFHVEQPYVPMHEVKFTTEGFYSRILRNIVPRSVLLYDANTDTYYYPEREEIPRHEVIQRHATDVNGRPKYTSTFKKSFIYMPKVQKPLPKIDIIVPFSFDGTTNADQMQYNSLAALVLCDTLSRLGIDFNLLAYYGNLTGSDLAINQFIVLKDTTMGFDMTQMALFLSDPRYYRYQRFRSFNAAYSDTNNDQRGSNGGWSTITNTDAIKNAYIDMLSLSGEPIDQESARIPNAKIVTQVARDMAEATAAYDEVVQFIRSLT
jgi:hypothetical protein